MSRARPRFGAKLRGRDRRGRDRRLGDRRGSVAVEFALTLPVLMLAFLAIFELYSLVAAQRTLDFAVDRALRYAAVHSTAASATTIAGVVTTETKALLGSAGASVAATVSFAPSYAPSYAPGNAVAITATYAWAPATLGTLFPAVTLASSGTVTVQN